MFGNIGEAFMGWSHVIQLFTAIDRKPELDV